MKNKLELKHIAPYLPYGLECQLMGEFEEDGETPIVFDLVGGMEGDYVSVAHKQSYVSDQWEVGVEDQEVFPILRPLSDLTKEIEHNGEKFVPMLRLLQIANGHFDEGELQLSDIPEQYSIETVNAEFEAPVYKVEYKSGMFQNHIFSFKAGCFNHFWRVKESGFGSLRLILVDNQEIIFEKLNEWHFDKYTTSLISKGLAIPK